MGSGERPKKNGCEQGPRQLSGAVRAGAGGAKFPYNMPIMPAALAHLQARYRRANPRSRALFERGRVYTAGAAKGAYYYPPYPLAMARGKGCYLWDVDGHRYVDCANHHTAQILGHGHERVEAAVREQVQQGIALGAPTGIESEIARAMCSRVEALERIRFVNSGTEATLHAVRLARGVTQRGKIAKFEGGYHGSHDAVEISVAPPLDQVGPAAAPAALPAAAGMSPSAASEALILPYHDPEAVERLVAAHASELACVLFDPKAGIMDVQPDFARAVRDITRRHKVLLVFDEIVGFRTGTGGLQGLYGIDPDLSCFGKIIGGGFPVGAFGGRADLMDRFDNSQPSTGFFQSGTFSAHPVAMAAGMATLSELTPQAIAHLNALGARLKDQLNALFAARAVAAQAVCTGSVFSIHFAGAPIANYRDLAAADQTLVQPLFLSLIEQGYFLGPGLGMCALSTPMDAGHIDGLVAAVGNALAAIT